MRRGGAGALMLKAKAYASAVNLPATAALNEIGVITTTAIATVYAQTDQPASPSAGDVWVKLGYISNIALNMATTGTLKIYPMFFKQYVAGAWVFVDAYAYYSSAWHKFTQYLYFEGGEYIAQCGGWQQGGHGTLTKYATYMTIYCNSSVGAASFRTVNMMDLTDYTTIKLRYYTISGINNTGRFGVTTSATPYSPNITSYVALPAASAGVTNTVTLDVSAFNGLYYIAFTMNSAEMTVQILDISAY